MKTYKTFEDWWKAVGVELIPRPLSRDSSYIDAIRKVAKAAWNRKQI